MADPLFVGRHGDFARLEQEWAAVQREGRGRLLVVRGRRRVGKSTLIDRFLRAQRIPHVFFTATEQAPEIDFERFLGELARSPLPAAEQLAGGLTPRDWEAALAMIADSAGGQPCAVVIDELPYLVAAQRGIESVLQVSWDRRLRHAPVLLILVGSNLAMMEALTEYERPLYGRVDRQLVIDPLTIAEVADLVQLDPVAAFDAYLAIGGFPELALTWKQGESLERFLARAVAESTSPLVVHGERVLRAELPAAAQPELVLRTIGADATTVKRIQDRTGINQASLHNALRTLERARLIVREQPFGAKPSSRLTRYVVADPALRFWLRFIGPQLELIERGRGRDLVLERIREQLASYRGRAVEPLVRRSLERLLPDARFGAAVVVGSYWNRDHSIELDLVGGASDRAVEPAALVGSIKWRDAGPFGSRDVAALEASAGRVPGLAADTTVRVGVSRGGFAADATGLDVALDARALVDAWR